MTERIIAIIPARSGSKGLADKNIADLNGHPLMYYTIKAALDSEIFDEVMVSTDSPEYARIAVSCGANVPFLRSELTSGDKAGSMDVIREVLNNYKELKRDFDKVCLLQPTSPLRDSEDITSAFKTLCNGGFNNLVSVCETEHPVQWCFTLPDNGSMDEFASNPDCFKRRQELARHYMENGAVYFIDAVKIMKDDYNYYADSCGAYIMDRTKSIDIDNMTDLIMAKLLLEQNKI